MPHTCWYEHQHHHLRHQLPSFVRAVHLVSGYGSAERSAQASGQLRNGHIGTLDHKSQFATEKLDAAGDTLSRPAQREQYDTRVEAQLDAVDGAGEGSWGNPDIGEFRTLRELHTTCTDVLNRLDKRGKYDVENALPYPDKELHLQLTLRRDRIERGGPVWSWNSGAGNDVFDTVAVMERNRTADRLTEMADMQDKFSRAMDSANGFNGRYKIALLAAQVRFSGDAKINTLNAAREAYETAERAFGRAKHDEVMLDSTPPDHITEEDYETAAATSAEAESALVDSREKFRTAFDETAGTIRTSTEYVRGEIEKLRDDELSRATHASKIWVNGWPADKDQMPEMPADFADSALTGNLWAIAQSYRD